jgi:hypothetical protein
MMPDVRLTLDHVGAVVGDLDQAARQWQRLGFTLAPQSRQRGAVPGQSGMQSWATANRCAIFERGYLELIGTVDPSAYNPWQRFVERFEGLHLVALRCVNADQAFGRLHAAAPFLDPPVARERKLTYRGEERTMRFRNIFSRDAECPEARYIVIEHQTPELLWQPELMQHENGARGLEEAWIVTDDAAVVRRAEVLDDVVKTIGTRAFAERFGWTPPAPRLAAITVAFADLARAIGLLEQRGIQISRRCDDIWIGPQECCGFIMRLTQHD